MPIIKAKGRTAHAAIAMTGAHAGRAPNDADHHPRAAKGIAADQDRAPIVRREIAQADHVRVEIAPAGTGATTDATMIAHPAKLRAQHQPH